jgi:class 3 adenylate cyclase
MEPVRVRLSVDLASAPEEVWPWVADTERTNRFTGSAPIAYSPIAGSADSPARFLGESVVGGVKMAFEEHPFEWVKGRYFRSYRAVKRGVLSSYEMRIDLAPQGQGTRVTFSLDLVSRVWFLKPAIAFQARRAVARRAQLLRDADAHARSGAPTPYEKPPSSIDELRLVAAERALTKAGVDETIAKKLCDHLRSAQDLELVRIRPFVLAQGLAEDPRAVLGAMLHAVPAGLVELRWAVVCPSCLTAADFTSALDEISTEGHCQLCDISFEIDLDRAVEATFHPHRSVRKVEERMFCMGSPARMAHVHVQANVDRDATREVTAPDEPGRYRLFARGGASASLEVEDGAPAEAKVAVQESGIAPAALRVKRGGTISVHNATGAARHLKIERLGYATQAATAHLVSTLPEFRSLFSKDLLKRGTPLKVSRVAIFFSDLTGSTALYSTIGDAAAFRLVDDHFDLLREVVQDHEGTLVKTMGDAVMAAFPDIGRGVSAGLAALERFEQFRRGRPNGDLVGLKLGVFSGPCYVVTANGSLDYFGQTVNVASRIQHLAESGQLLLEEAQLDSLDDAARSRLWVGQRFKTRVKGVDSPLALVRVSLADRASGTSAKATSPLAPAKPSK